MFEAQIAHSYEAMNRKDLDAVMAAWAEGGVFEFPGRTPISGRHEGKEAIRAFFGRIFDELESMHFTIRHVAMSNPVGLTLSNMVYVDWTVDEVTRDGRRFSHDGITVLKMKGGKAVWGRDYFFDLAGLEAMWPASVAGAAG